MSEAAPLEGTVARLDARGCVVRLDESRPTLPDDGRTIWCSVRGKIHLRDRTGQQSPLAVGDRVRVRETTAGRGNVVEAVARRSLLSRPAVTRRAREQVIAANVDRLLVVGSAADPPLNTGLVDRILAVGEWSRLESILVVNKVDLVPEAPPEVETYRRMGYEVLLASARTGTGIERVREALRGRTSVVVGHSGVGKSSLLNAVQPGLGLPVREVNPVSGRGTHTTTAAVWVPLLEGGAVIDTAGVREFGLWGIPRRDLSWLFRDIAAVAPACRFPDCGHSHEPDCAVREAAGDGRISPSRYASYLRILEAMGEPRGG